MSKPPLILDIKGNSLDDGPGIRSVVFFKGCPLSCQWCHNPESQATGRQLSHDLSKCIGCQNCLTTCPTGAIALVNRGVFVDRRQCNLCLDCCTVCPSGALSPAGRQMSLTEILETICKDKPFFDNSGGGVTLSGGEPTLFPAFTGDLARALQAEGISVLLETCGHFPYDRFIEAIDPFVDLIYFDLKLLDPDRHRHYCGLSNETILHNFKLLQKRSQNGGTPLLPRTPLIPRITDTLDNLTALAAFYRTHQVEQAALLSYNPLWHDKYTQLGLGNPLGLRPELKNFPDPSREARSRQILEDQGLQVI